jgi:formylglycine-generating enzyme required for sulfatase activity
MKRLAVFAALALALLAAFGIYMLRRPAAAPPEEAPPGMVWIPGGEFTMGTDSDVGWPDEKPAHRVRVDGFWMDATEVTNAQFREFVNATGYLTTAEQTPNVADIMRQLPDGAPPPSPDKVVPGAPVFAPTKEPVPLNEPEAYRHWWKWTPGASWQHPEGPGSDLKGREDHPVVCVSWDDAVAYAAWARKRLPTEAEWERAARGGLDNQPYTWGSAKPGAGGKWQCNIWQGEFPVKNTLADGFERTAPVKSYPPNGYGLYDMAGNVWEWCHDWYQHDLYAHRANIVVHNPQGPSRSSSPGHSPLMPLRVQKGGSFLCNDAYCTRYRPSARHAGAPDTGLSHAGFRCVRSPQSR